MHININIWIALSVLVVAFHECCSSNHSLKRKKQKYSVNKSSSQSEWEDALELEHLYVDQPADQPTRCKTIPKNFGLCHGMEYIRMRIPNLLGHETMNEIMRQSKPWPALVAKNCHPETRKFLCSLFAPVCMKDYEHSIQPCRSLCESVESACSPAMAKFGYPWPKILNCTQFPSADSQLCIPESPLPPANPDAVPKTCTSCHQKKAHRSLRKKFCTFDFVMKVRIKRFMYKKGHTKIHIRSNKKKIFRWPESIPKPKKIFLWMKGGLHCTCSVLSNNKTYYIVAGWMQKNKLTLYSITKWNRKYKKVVRRFKRKRCSSTS